MLINNSSSFKMGGKMEIRRITLKDLNRVFELLNELYTKNKI